MKKVEWDRWRAVVWGRSIKRNAGIKVECADVNRSRTLRGRIIGATEQRLLMQIPGSRIAIHYKRVKSIEKMEGRAG